MVVSLALAALLQSCAPAAHPQTMAAIISVESSGWLWTIHDNDADRSYYMPSFEQGVSVGERLMREGHNVDIGIAQVNSIHLREYGLSVAGLMAPCNNVRIGSLILKGDWDLAVRTFGYTQEALDHTVMAYNTGSLFHGKKYRNSVIQAAGTLRFEAIRTTPAPSQFASPAAVIESRRIALPAHASTQDTMSQRIAQYPPVILSATEVAIPK